MEEVNSINNDGFIEPKCVCGEFGVKRHDENKDYEVCVKEWMH